MAKLMQGFYMPQEGKIGIDVRHLATTKLRAGFGVMPQETVLFSGTVYGNLLAANPQASFEATTNAQSQKTAALTSQYRSQLQTERTEVMAQCGVIGATSAASASNPLTYRALIKLNTQYLEQPASSSASGQTKRLPLEAGMAATAEIHQGHRSVMEYLLSPVQKVAHEAGRER